MVTADAAMAVPGPGLGVRLKPAGVAEALLEQGAGVVGDAVSGLGRVTVVEDGDDFGMAVTSRLWSDAKRNRGCGRRR